MKKLSFILLCILSIILYTACNEKKQEENQTNETEEVAVAMPNPFEEASDIDEAQKLAGFKIKVSEKFQDYERTMIEVIKDELIQVLFENSNNEIYFRKAKGEGQDISGDYNEYSDIKEVEYKGIKITLKGENGVYHLAIWSKGKFSYSFDSSNDLEEKIIFEFVDMVE